MSEEIKSTKLRSGQEKKKKKIDYHNLIVWILFVTVIWYMFILSMPFDLLFFAALHIANPAASVLSRQGDVAFVLGRQKQRPPVLKQRPPVFSLSLERSFL